MKLETNEKANLIRARGVANDIIEELCITAPDQIQLEAMAMHRGLLIMEAPLKGADALLVRKGDHGLLKVKKGISNIGRKRFITAHDFGHWELHKGQSQWKIFSDSDLKGYLHSPMELEATMFASELLMPTKMFRPLCQDIEPDLKSIISLADTFKVSLTACAIRFIQENNNPCVVVFSDRGKVTWWKANDNCPRVWIEKNQLIHNYSYAADCVNSNDFQIRGGDVENTKYWFKDASLPEGVYEESIRLGDNDKILTLLWVI